MVSSSFWLIYIQENSVSVSLVSSSQDKFQLLATGPSKNWDQNDDESLAKSVDESLSVASLNANITEEEEPELAAFVVPPFWVGSDAKILPQRLKYIKELCKKMSFTPTGFLAEDEALVEDSNKSDSLPSSFILVHLTQNEFYLSLVYLGHIKERIRKGLDGEVDGQILESALLEIKTESTLPPQIIIFGQVNNQLISSLKDYPWIGKKNIETFLHLPDISLYDDNDLIATFTRVITSQISGNLLKNNQNTDSDEEEETVSKPNDISEKLSLNDEDQVVVSEMELNETSPEDLGFTITNDQDQVNQENQIETEKPNLDTFESPVVLPTIIPEEIGNNKKGISFDFLKKIKLPKLKLNFNLFWIILIILPFLALLPFIFSSANITLFINPYRFEKTASVTLDTNASVTDISSLIIPVQKEIFDVKVSTKVETTGQKTVGEKAKGEIIIYNKLSEIKNIPKGSVLTNSSGKKFELASAVSVASSSSSFNDQDNLVTVSGQTKSAAIAADIGSEFNISAESQLIFKDYPQSSLIAKTETDFSGGSKQQIRAVSKEDKTEVQSKIDNEITKAVEDKINQTLGNVSGVIKETIQSDKGNLDLSREIGETADELSGTLSASVSVFIVSASVKQEILKQLLINETDFDKVNLNPDDFNLEFKIKKISSTQATATLTISGKSLPKIDNTSLQKALSVKTIKQANETIRKIIPRAYNFNIGTNLPLLPFNPQNINIEIKTENL
jgi:hypothetical protein